MPSNNKRRLALGGTLALLAASIATAGWAGVTAGSAGASTVPAGVNPPPVQRALDLSAANRRAPLPGLPDWSKAGYRGGQPLPDASDINPSTSCQITPSQLASTYGVVPNDGKDDTNGIQAAIDKLKSTCSPTNSYTKLSLITFPAGVLNVTHEIEVDANYTILRGSGTDPATGTAFEYRPDANTLYDVLTPDGTDSDGDNMTSGDGKMGWAWPGTGLFRVSSRTVDPSYQSEYNSAPANRKEIFLGSINQHWKAGVKLRAKPGETKYAARQGDTVVYLATNAKMTNLKVGGFVNMMAANSQKFYQSMDAVSATYPEENLQMRQQIFTISAVDTTNHTVTIDKPLEYDMPIDSTSDGSAPIDGSVYASNASPLVEPVVGVGLENFYMTQPMSGLNQADSVQNYGNMDPHAEMNGIVLKWAVNDWVKGIRSYMTGSHPIVTEEAKNVQIQDNFLDGSWNKGAGGRGYFRGSRVWDSLYADNVTRNLRHFTFQWSASDNVAIGNDIDSDFNMHGGYERRNLIELNTQAVPYDHRAGNCKSNCGDDGGGTTTPDTSNWYPIYWTAGQKGVKWSGASGPQNVFFDNTMTKQLSTGGPYQPYYPQKNTIYQFGVAGPSDGAYHLLDVGGTPIADWAKNETKDYTGGHGVDASRTDSGQSLFLKSVAPVSTPTDTPTVTPTDTPTPTPTDTPTSTPTDTPTSTPTTSGPPTSPGKSYEAEKAVLGTGTTVTSCAHCSGGKKISFLGSATFSVTAPTDGTYPMTISFMSVGSVHSATVTAGGATQTVNFPSTPDYNTVVTLKVSVSLQAGTNPVVIANTAGTGPNLDRIKI